MGARDFKKTVTEIDIRTLETIYADGRALGFVIERMKERERGLMTENLGMKEEIRTLKYRLKQAARELALLSGGRGCIRGNDGKRRSKSLRLDSCPRSVRHGGERPSI